MFALGLREHVHLFFLSVEIQLTGNTLYLFSLLQQRNLFISQQFSHFFPLVVSLFVRNRKDQVVKE